MPTQKQKSIPRPQRGFTLMEAIVVIVITGIISAMVGVFIRKPIDAYFDTVNRAELADIADTALRRMGREINGALPNSVRVDASNQFLEFVPIKAAGRYRADFDTTSAGCSVAAPCGDPLDFTSNTDHTADILGPPVDFAASDYIVIYNLGIPGSDYYEGTSRRNVTAAATAATKIDYVITPVTGVQFPFASPGSRFHVVNVPVTYECAPNSVTPASGKLIRHTNYGITYPAQKTSGFPASDPLLATDVDECTVTYSPGTQQRNGLVSIHLKLTKNHESVTLLHQVSVNNTP